MESYRELSTVDRSDREQSCPVHQLLVSNYWRGKREREVVIISSREAGVWPACVCTSSLYVPCIDNNQLNSSLIQTSSDNQWGKANLAIPQQPMRRDRFQPIHYLLALDDLISSTIHQPSTKLHYDFHLILQETDKPYFITCSLFKSLCRARTLTSHSANDNHKERAEH